LRFEVKASHHNQSNREVIPGLPPWALKTLREIVKDPSYKGDPARVGKTTRIPGGGYHPSGGRKAEPTGEGVPVGESTPAIVTAEVWGQANEQARSRSHAVAKHHTDWLIGRVFCATCGTRLVRFRHSRRGYLYWRCSGRRIYGPGRCGMGHANDRIIRGYVTERLAPFLSDPAIREAKLAKLREVLADPEWEAEADRNQAEITRLKGKLAKTLARFGDDDDLDELLGEQIETLKRQLAAREETAISLAEKVAASRRATEGVDQVRGLFAAWPVGLLESAEGPQAFDSLSDEDKRLVCETVGLRVEVAKSVPGQVAVRVWVFAHDFMEAFRTERLPLDTSLG